MPDRSTLPQAWLDKLASASIPNIPVAVGTGQPTYPGREITDPEICSFTYECSHPDDLQTPPAGILAITFDDGPAGGSDSLWKYLDAQNGKGNVTHFMIGSYITRKLVCAVAELTLAKTCSRLSQQEEGTSPFTLGHINTVSITIGRD